MRKGILLDETGDLAIKVIKQDGLIISGLVIGESDYQNIDFNIKGKKNDLKQYPTLCVDAERFLKSTGKAKKLRREIAINLEADGYKTNDITLSETGELEINI